MSRISIIVPVCNNEETLERCVGSILAQTRSNLDVILVDDGSDDISGALCDAYAEFDQRVRVFHTSNNGLSAARNLGIDQALEDDAELIAFADADDYLMPKMLEELLGAMESTGADIAQCGVRVEGFCSTEDEVPLEAVYDRVGAVRAHLHGDVSCAVWNKLYRSFLFKELRFPEGRVHEGMATTYQVLLLCEKLVSIPRIGYCYVMRANSITHGHTMGGLADYWVAHLGRYERLSLEGPGLLDEESRNCLAIGPATAISTMWRWAYASPAGERAEYSALLQEMQRFEREVLRGIDKRNWPLRVTLPLLLVRSRSNLALAIGYYINQVVIGLYPSKSFSRR